MSARNRRGAGWRVTTPQPGEPPLEAPEQPQRPLCRLLDLGLAAAVLAFATFMIVRLLIDFPGA